MATIVLDPGHGGTRKVGGSSPNNATGPNGLKEKEVTLKVALAAETALAGSGVRVLLTRRTDKNLGIADRAAVAEAVGAEAFISIHFNAPGGTTPAQGTETFIGVGHTPASRRLADAVQRETLAVTGYRDRGVKVATVSGVIKPTNHAAATASCLVEISFLSLQRDEEARLRTQAYIDALGEAIAEAARSYLGEPGLLGDEAGLEAGLEAEPEDAASARRMGLLADEEALVDEAAEGVEAGAGAPEVGDEIFGVPFNDLDAFERVTEAADDVAGDFGAEDGPGGLEAVAVATIAFGPNARDADVTAFSRQVLTDVMRRAGLASVTISSTSRSPAEQARVMFNNLERFGVAHQKALYGAAGDGVIEVYRSSKRDGLPASAIKARMEREIVRVGPTRVSRHASDPNILNVFDIAPSSVARRPDFERALRTESRISKTIFSPNDPGYHLEIPQPGS